MSLHQDLDGLAEPVELEDLAADVGVQADQVEMRRHQGLPNGFQRDPVPQSEPELGVHLPGLDIGMSVRFHPWGDTQQNRLLVAAGPGYLFQQSEFLEAIDHHETNPAGKRVLQFGAGLVVAMKEDALGGEAGRLGHVILPARRHVYGEALFQHHLLHRHRGERLAGVDDLEVVGVLPEGSHVPAALVADGLLLVDHEGRAELGHQIDHVAAVDLKVPR